ncbi:MAG: prepilin peptidase [Ilumatobacteraceae bacterium]
MLTTTAQPTRTAAPLLVAAALGIAIAQFWSPISAAVVAALVPLTAAARVDALDRRLPDRLVALSAVPVGVVCLVDPFVDRLSALGGVVAGASLLAVPLLALHLIAPASMGFGDVKTSAALGATLGLVDPVLSLWTLCLASALTAAWGVARGERHVALGPGLVVAATVVLVVASGRGVEAVAWR